MVMCSVRIVLAYPRPSGSQEEDPLLAALRPHWESAGFALSSVPLSPQTSSAALQNQLVEQVDRHASDAPLVLGGFSLGARIATMVASHFQPQALLLLGFPFHKRGDPQNQHGLPLVRALTIDSLILQGSRDDHGSKQEVAGLASLPVKQRFLYRPDPSQPTKRS